MNYLKVINKIVTHLKFDEHNVIFYCDSMHPPIAERDGGGREKTKRKGVREIEGRKRKE